MSFPNIWHHRKVADTSAKACELCFKPSTSVLFNPENKDFFYVCLAHIKDRGFCSPIIDQEAIAAKKKKEMEEELEKVKKEYEEKQRKKQEKNSKKSEEEKDKAKDDEGNDSKKPEKKDDLKPNSKDKADDNTSPKPEEEPRVFALQRTFYQQRLDRKRQAEMAKRNRERLSNPSYFPSVPKDLP
ncbi:DUF1742-domain-containing protein [Hypoxylon fragiforme]|uniref:DUF1742-domain-containing protein n=1 Tax=Hypoxylon fragiforme TaxID=63214 RepID=UPI0020C6F2AD|nr:DUF1742-domain-containing protein [Hypoxylon fragiforme]KAI2611131.1 DUF1742-domain-containing protein [Hypoxylon fragiforme]